MPYPFSLRNFDLNLLKVFDHVMTERSLTRAATRLALTQPAVSNAMRRLRETLGDELLVRRGRALEPTPRAEALWPAVQNALRGLQASLAPVTFVPASSEETFVLTMADATAAQLMPGLMRGMEQAAPQVSLRVVPLTTRDPRQLLEQGQADLAIGHFPAVLADLTAKAQAGAQPGFHQHRLFTSDYVCVMRKDHPLAGQALDLDAFCAARHMLVSFSGRAFGFIDEALALHQRRRQVVLTVNQFFTAGKVVVNSDMLTVLPRHFVSMTGYADQLAMRELPMEVPKIHIDAVWHQRMDNVAAQVWLRDNINTVAHTALTA